ncbi:MAG TPA: 3-phosphoshikimate 1-carboxyvinyltransferase [Patescibacteria group bacterium]|nr:3-phosphoshikimate 1-carboxyvinyltransferase [Patescibacteria group bacterium]
MTGLISHPVSSLKGVARAPGDKSISHRSLMFGALAEGETVISGLLNGEDVLHTGQALSAMGAEIHPATEPGGTWRVKGIGATGLKTPRNTVYLGNSGTSTRLLMGVVGGYPIHATFTGDASLSKRPMGRVIKPLAQMGVQFEASHGDMLPLKIIGSGQLRPIEYTLPVASAQVKSAILFAALHAEGETTVIEPEPTRDHTERMLRFFGAEIESRNDNGANIIKLKGLPRLTGQPVTVPSDPSSAAFLTVAALITKDSDILIPGVSVNPLRAGLYDTLRDMGADIVFENQRELSGEPVADIRVKSSALKGVTVPKSRVPSMIDEFPVLSVAASFAEGDTYMSDLKELRVKESDRLLAIAKGLTACGVLADMGDDDLTVHGRGQPPGGCMIAANLDHRIAMSFLVMGMATREAVSIDDAETMNTSFPGFAALMNSLGAKINPAA